MDDEFDPDMAELVTADALSAVQSLSEKSGLGPRAQELLAEIADLAGVPKPPPPPEERKGSISATACVVCGRSDRAMVQRKSGLKCTPFCIGKPTTGGGAKAKDVIVQEMKYVRQSVNDKGQEVINDLVLESRLGRGAFGSVMLARHPSGQEYAVKVLSKARLKRVGALSKVQAEIEILKKLQHPHIMRIYTIFDDPSQDNLYLVMEYLPNGESYRLNADGTGAAPIELARLRRYAFGIARGLQYLHSHGVAHRDIKPENILLDARDNVKLADFGVSSDRTFADATEGSPAFFPPEEFQGVPVTGLMQDIWAFGVTLFCMAFGRLPFWAESHTELGRLVVETDVPIPDDADPQLRSLLCAMLAKDPEQRASLEMILGHPFLQGLRSIKGRPEAAYPVSFVHGTDVPMGSCSFTPPIPSCRAAMNLYDFCYDKGPDLEVLQAGDYSVTIYPSSVKERQPHTSSSPTPASPTTTTPC